MFLFMNMKVYNELVGETGRGGGDLTINQNAFSFIFKNSSLVKYSSQNLQKFLEFISDNFPI